MTDQLLQPGQVWVDADGAHLYVTGVSLKPPYVVVVPAELDDDGDWGPAAGGERREVSEEWLQTTCRWEPPPPDPPDPRIARLAQLVDELLAGYSAAAAGERPTGEHVDLLTAQVRAALAEVGAIPEEERLHRHRAVRQAARSGFQRGRVR